MILLVLLFSAVVHSQELCNNGIDDDSNGLIDLNDTVGCTCTSPVLSLIPNPSFEAMNCCPSTFTQLNCAQSWIQASDGTSDYVNTCDFVFPAAIAAGLGTFPDGNGAAGFISSDSYREYIGACLTSPMLANSSYSLQINIASTPIDNQGGQCNGGTITYSASDIVLYGSTNCGDLPFSGYGCPPSNWQILGTITYTPVSSWGTITITFTPSVNINAIIIGSPCTLPSDYVVSSCYPYFYVDNLLLNLTSLFTSNITQSGALCNNNLQLTGGVVPGASYQWYINGVAIVGQTSVTLDVSANNLPVGNYTLLTSVGSNCANSSFFVSGLNYSPEIDSSGVGSFCQNQPPVTLTVDSAGGVWTGTGITDSLNGIFDPSVAVLGNNVIIYTIQDTLSCSKSDTITIVVKASPSVALTILPPVACWGDTVLINALITGGSGTYTSTVWSGSGAFNLSSTTIANPTFTGWGGGSYALSFTVTDDQGCIGSVDTSIVVKEQPFIGYFGVPYYVCAGDTMSVVADYITGGSGTYISAFWSGSGSGFLSDIFADSTTFSTTLTGLYSLSYTVIDSNGCSDVATLTTTVMPVDDASFIYSSASFCHSGIDPAPAITGVSGGTFSSIPAGLAINSTTGIIDLSASATGTYIVSYATTDIYCPNTYSVAITIADTALSATFNYSSASFCQNGVNPLPQFGNGSSAGLFSAIPAGLIFANSNTGEIDLSASLPGTYTVSNSISSSGTCNGDVSTSVITISPSDNALFSYSSATYCTSGVNPTPLITGLPGGTFSSVPAGLSLNPSTGTINLSLSTTGMYTLSYTTSGNCPATSSILMTIADSTPTASFSYQNAAFCQGENNPFPLYAGGSAGLFSASPAGLVFVHVNTGEIDITASTPGTYTVTNTIPPSGSCSGSSFSSTITINAAPVISSTSGLQMGCDGMTTAIALTSTIPGASFTWTVVQLALTGASAGTGSTISQTLNLSGTSQGTVSYTVIPSANGCSGLAVVFPFILNPLPVGDTSGIIYTPSLCGEPNGGLFGITMTSGQPAFQYEWTDTAGTVVGTSSNLNNVVPGIYTLNVTDANGCSMNVGSYQVSSSSSAVIAGFTLDPLTGENPLTVNFTNTSIGAVSYQWQFGTGDTSSAINPTYIYIPYGTFNVCLVATSNLGCMDTACSTIDVAVNSVFVIPNVFSPNNDNINDEFKIIGEGFKTLDVEIYNRWGQKLYEWHTINGSWNGYTASGVLASEGTYYYIVSATKTDEKKYDSKGYFSLLRD